MKAVRGRRKSRDLTPQRNFLKKKLRKYEMYKTVLIK
jgi:hypothetical protein